ncbi:MAG: hypothetical protein AAGD09_19130 [Cyanobacteria bacterium P01_F01_bin.56]
MSVNDSDVSPPLFYSSDASRAPEENLTETQAKSMDAYWKAREAYDVKDYQEVLDYLDQALALDPENAAALMRSSMMHSFLAEYDTAISHLERARAVLRKQGRSDAADNLELDLEALKGLQRDNEPPSITLK